MVAGPERTTSVASTIMPLPSRDKVVSSEEFEALAYLGSRMSLTTNKELRYEGVLDGLDLRESSVTLRSVRCMGTEGRRVPQIPPRDPQDLLDFMVFHGEAIVDLRALRPPEVGDLYYGDDIGPICSEKPYRGVRQITPSGSSHKMALRNVRSMGRLAFGRRLPEVPPWVERLQEKRGTTTKADGAGRAKTPQPGRGPRRSSSRLGAIEALSTRSFSDSFGLL